MFSDHNPNLLIGHHGCDKSVGENLLNGGEIQISNNDYDWLGPGFYVWEGNPKRAYSFAQEKQQGKVGKSNITDPFVIGVVYTLGNCIDTLAEESIIALTGAYEVLVKQLDSAKQPLPKNKAGSDLLLRQLDCAVIRTLHSMASGEGVKIDSVRALFHEGGELYENSGFCKKSHAQVAISNLECIKGFFRLHESTYCD